MVGPTGQQRRSELKSATAHSPAGMLVQLPLEQSVISDVQPVSRVRVICAPSTLAYVRPSWLIFRLYRPGAADGGW